MLQGQESLSIGAPRWNLGRTRVQLSRLVRSLEFSNSEKLRLMGLMKATVEKIRPLEQELNKLERKADHTKKEYRKNVQKDIRIVKAKIAEMEEETKSTALELQAHTADDHAGTDSGRNRKTRTRRSQPPARRFDREEIHESRTCSSSI